MFGLTAVTLLNLTHVHNFLNSNKYFCAACSDFSIDTGLETKKTENWMFILKIPTLLHMLTIVEYSAGKG